MNFLARSSVLGLLALASICCDASVYPECFADEVEAHVLRQFGIYGPLSAEREHFGFIFRHDGGIGSAVSRGSPCRWTEACEVDTRVAAALIPKGAKVLGEWHTHPHVTGSQSLSPEDVRGANRNVRISCYRAFFSTSSGEIYSWNPHSTFVRMAMATSVRLGNYRQKAAPVHVADSGFANRQH